MMAIYFVRSGINMVKFHKMLFFRRRQIPRLAPSYSRRLVFARTVKNMLFLEEKHGLIESCKNELMDGLKSTVSNSSHDLLNVPTE
jgi:hypothetical protein